MKKEREILVSRDNRLEPLKSVWRSLLVYVLIKHRSVAPDKIDLTDEDWKVLETARLLPPKYLPESGKKLQLTEYVWLALVKKLQKAGFNDRRIQWFKSQFFARYIPFNENEEEQTICDTGLVALDNLLYAFFIGEKDIQIRLFLDGRIEVDPQNSLSDTTSEHLRVDLSLIQVLAEMQGLAYSPATFHQVEVNAAELALLAAVRNPEYQEVSVEKIADKLPYRWVLSTIQNGTACEKTLHEIVAKFSKRFGKLEIAGIGKSFRIPYRYTETHRL